LYKERDKKESERLYNESLEILKIVSTARKNAGGGNSKN